MKHMSLFAPGLLAIFPSLFLYFTNEEIARLPLYVLLPSLGVLALIIICITIGAAFLLKSRPKGVILTSLAVCSVFYYNFFFEFIQVAHLTGIIPLRHRVTMPLWLFTFLVLGVFVWKTRRDLFSVSKWIGLFAYMLILISTCSFVVGIFQKNSGGSPRITNEENFSLERRPSALGYMPDVYYIIPDEYAGSQVLKEFFGYDNHEFISFLESRGFVVADNSRSVYPRTYLSIPSTLNMEYGESLIPDYWSAPPAVLRDLMEENRVGEIFKGLEYTYIAIATDNTTFTGRTADKNFGPSLLFRFLSKPTILDPFSQRFRDRILDAFNSFEEAAMIESPKFVFAHILAPHDPFVFGPNGEDIGFNSGVAHSTEDLKLYLGQLQYINTRLKETVDIILEKSSRPPVIIIQSDHGIRKLPASYGTQILNEVEVKNFSAYLLPGEAKENMPEFLSTINTFRFLFDEYFGTSFGLLEEEN